ncbi:MAG: hypothetical protein JW862_12385, partial [Anaerolineales bacterium]|nr:hypothetical protein [Anaerolineales bacterium]
MSFLETIPSNWQQPALALFIILDEFGAEVTRDVYQFITSPGSARGTLETSLSLHLDLDNHELRILSGQEHPGPCCQINGEEFDRSRSQSARLIEGNLDLIQQVIDKALHDLRNHENLIKAGYGSGLPPSLYVFLLADLKEPASAGALIPLIGQLSDSLSNDPYASLLLFLDVAQFPWAVPADNATALVKAAQTQWRHAEAQIAHALQTLDAALAS